MNTFLDLYIYAEITPFQLAKDRFLPHKYKNYLSVVYPQLPNMRVCELMLDKVLEIQKLSNVKE